MTKVDQKYFPMNGSKMGNSSYDFPLTICIGEIVKLCLLVKAVQPLTHIESSSCQHITWKVS